MSATVTAERSPGQLHGITYDQIITFAENEAPELKNAYNLPSLPDDIQLAPYRDWMWDKDPRLITAVQNHLRQHGIASGHSFEDHMGPIAVKSAYAADCECEIRQIGGEKRERIVQRAWRLGLLHDLQRVRGYMPDENHQVESSWAAAQILHDVGIDDPVLSRLVAIHDELEIDIIGDEDPEILIPFACMHVVDKLQWGIGVEKNRWEERRHRGDISPEEAMQEANYIHMFRLLKSKILEQTDFGRNVVRPYIQYGLDLARHIKEYFLGSVKTSIPGVPVRY